MTTSRTRRCALIRAAGLWNNVDFVEGHQLQLTNADGSRTLAAIYMHENKLYILEGTVPEGYPEPGIFQHLWAGSMRTGSRFGTGRCTTTDSRCLRDSGRT